MCCGNVSAVVDDACYRSDNLKEPQEQIEQAQFVCAPLHRDGFVWKRNVGLQDTLDQGMADWSKTRIRVLRNVDIVLKDWKRLLEPSSDRI